MNEILMKSEKRVQQNRLKWTLKLKTLHKRNRSSLISQINKSPQKKNFGNVKKKHEMPYLTIHQSSQCRVIMQMTYTKTQQLWMQQI